jgi:hypothetical protein
VLFSGCLVLLSVHEADMVLAVVGSTNGFLHEQKRSTNCININSFISSLSFEGHYKSYSHGVVWQQSRYEFIKGAHAAIRIFMGV